MEGGGITGKEYRGGEDGDNMILPEGVNEDLNWIFGNSLHYLNWLWTYGQRVVTQASKSRIQIIIVILACSMGILDHNYVHILSNGARRSEEVSLSSKVILSTLLL